MERITAGTKPERVVVIKNKAGVAFYEAKYGDRWGCPICLEFRHADGQEVPSWYCSCTKARLAGQDIDDPACVWNQLGYQPEDYWRIDWENVEQEAKHKQQPPSRKKQRRNLGRERG